MAISDRDRGLQALRWYFDHSDLPHDMSFEDLVAYYDDQGIGEHIARFGAALRVSELGASEWQPALEDVIHRSPGAVPNIQDLQLALVNPTQSVRFSEVIKKTVEDTVQAVDVIQDKVKWLLIAGAVLYGLVLFAPFIKAAGKSLEKAEAA
jgi:hypothetical protein